MTDSNMAETTMVDASCQKCGSSFTYKAHPAELSQGWGPRGYCDPCIADCERDRPCFCERCIYVTIDDLITERAGLLDASLRDHLYMDGYEQDLAENLIHGIPAGRRRAVLEHMLQWEHLYQRVMCVDCLLDETDDRSYEALAEMNRTLLAAIDAQDTAPHALQVLILNAIQERRHLLPTLRELKAS